MISISIPAEAVAIAHPDVAAYQCILYDDCAVAAVMLRPLYGRSDRQRVLNEVASSVARTVYPDGVETTADDAMERVFTVYVVADVDVYQTILHGERVDVDKLARRGGCCVLRLVPSEDGRE